MKTILLYRYYFLIFVLVGVIVYFPIFFNGFAWDDLDLIINYTPLHQLNFTIFFDNFFNTGPVYRQVTVFYHSLLYSLFKENAFPYHFIQLLLHIICTSLIFVLFTKYFQKGLAFLLSLFFLIHPINVESVAWISAVANQLFVIPGIIALLIAHKKDIGNKSIYILCFSLFISLLAYEYGIFFIVLTLFYLYLRKSHQLKLVLFFNFLLLVFYFFLRFIGYALFTSFAHPQPFPPITIVEKLLLIPSLIMHYLMIIVYPVRLMVLQYWIIKSVTFKDVILPTIFVLTLVIFLFRLFTHTEKKKKSAIIFYSAWLVLGLLPLLQIIPMNTLVADRWFYFPFIGLLGIFGFVVQHYILKLKIYKHLLLGLFVIILLLFSYRIYLRTFDWRDTDTLFRHDLTLQPDNVQLNYNLGTRYIIHQQYRESIPYLEKATAAPHYRNSLYLLGISYDNVGNYEKAIQYYRRAKNEIIEPYPKDEPYKDIVIIRALMNAKHYQEVSLLITDQAIENSQFKSYLLYFRAESNFKLQQYEKALMDIEYLRYMNKESSDPVVEDLYKQVKEAQSKNN